MTTEPQQLHPEPPTIDHADIRWRVSNTWDKGDTKMGMLVGYIDARTCMDALDELDPNWSAVHGDPIIVGSDLLGVPCALTVNGVTRSDVGMPSSQEPIKGAYSDALKRAAVHHGIGRELYELPKIAVECDVRNGKVKGPKALPVYHKGRWTIDRQYGWVKYDREPDDQPDRSERATDAGRRSGGKPATTSGPVQRTPGEQMLLDRLLAVSGMTTARLTLLADAVGVSKGERANADQLRAMIVRATTPEAEARSTPATVTPESAGSPATDSGSSAPSDEQLLAAAGEGAELIPPKRGTPEYEALPSGVERAAATRYWNAREKDEPQQETLAEALGAPGSDR